MKTSELEAKVHGIIDRVTRKQPVEDSLVELKSDWIDPKKASRHLAALCNAARGEPVLWLVGVDEDRGAIGVQEAELSNWWAQVRAEFDQQPPTLIQNVAAPVGDNSVVALLFDTTRAPFVTKNPVVGGPVVLEVPWREGNATRSARREDLIRILVPAVRVPEVELLDARASCLLGNCGLWRTTLTLDVYVIVRSPIILIAHRSVAKVQPEHLNPQVNHAQGGRRFAGEIKEGASVTEADVVLSRPARLSFTAYGPMTGIGPNLPAEIEIHMTLKAADLDSIPTISARLINVKTEESRVSYGLKR